MGGETQRQEGRLFGFILVALGLIALLAPFLTGISLSIFFGILLLTGGVLGLIRAFSSPEWTGIIVQIVLAIVYIVGGFVLILNPVVGLGTLTIVLLVYLVIQGLAEILLGLRMREEEYAFGIVLSGILSMLLGYFIWAGWPASSIWAVGLLFALSLVSTGISILFFTDQTLWES